MLLSKYVQEFSWYYLSIWNNFNNSKIILLVNLSREVIKNPLSFLGLIREVHFSILLLPVRPSSCTAKSLFHVLPSFFLGLGFFSPKSTSHPCRYSVVFNLWPETEPDPAPLSTPNPGALSIFSKIGRGEIFPLSSSSVFPKNQTLSRRN